MSAPFEPVDIGDAARRVGVTPATLRLYERRGLLDKPQRSANGYRQYSREDLQRARLVRRARRAGLSLRHIAQLIAQGRNAGCVRALLLAHLARLECESARTARVRRHLQRWLHNAGGAVRRHPHDTGETA